MNRTIPNTAKLRNVNTTLRTCPVRKDWTREWSDIRCIRSPISFVSKNDIGSFKSFMKKSLRSEMLMRMDMWSSSHRRMKSVAVRPMTIISSPSRMSHMRFMLLSRMPRSTIACVRNGNISCMTHPANSPSIISAKYF